MDVVLRHGRSTAISNPQTHSILDLSLERLTLIAENVIGSCSCLSETRRRELVGYYTFQWMHTAPSGIAHAQVSPYKQGFKRFRDQPGNQKRKIFMEAYASLEIPECKKGSL